MKFSPAPQGFLGLFLTFLLFISTSAIAGDPLITGSFSGVWDQPEQESQGFVIQIGEQEGDKKVGVAYWFTYGSDLQSAWYIGIGSVAGNEIHMDLYMASDIGFMADNMEDNGDAERVGTLSFVFQNCNKGVATYAFNEVEGVSESGEFPIKRFLSIYRQRCSGGISDDTPAGGKPLQLEVRLNPAVEGESGYGKAKFWERTDRSDFKVEVEDIADGTYLLKICGDHEDPLVEVKTFDLLVAGGEGELGFRSPEIDDKLNLNFDPRGCKIEVLAGADVVLTSGDAVLSEKVKGPKDKEDKDGTKIEADLTNTGVVDGAKGEAELEIWAGETEFSVKIKSVPVGIYTVWVAGENVGEIEVEDNAKHDGKLKLIDPSFDPRGKNILVKQADDQVILKVLFPEE